MDTMYKMARRKRAANGKSVDIVLNNMDNIFRHLGALPRRFPCPFRVMSVGYLGRKKGRVRQVFPSFNVSFVLSGGGDYRYRGEVVPVAGPMAITQWPGEHYDYGPIAVREFWEELYVVFTAESLPALKRSGLADRDRPWWRFGDPAAFLVAVERFLAELAVAPPPYDADRLDRAVEGLLFESLQGPKPERGSPEGARIEGIRQELLQRFREPLDLDALARRHGLSPATFRRHWGRRVGVTPGRYLSQLRLQEACRLLVESGLRVGEVADRCGFRDPLYFSRRLRQWAGLSPRAYRAAMRRTPPG